MPKTSVPDWDATAANNTDVGSINIDEGCPAPNVNNAMREIMSQIKKLFTTAVTFTAAQKAQFRANIGATNVLVNRVRTATGAASTGSTTMTADDSIPQSSEGDQYMSVAITPADAANILIVDVVMHLGHAVNTALLIAALFKDSETDARAVSWSINFGTSGIGTVISFSYEMTAGGTSETTFKVRAGSPSSSGGSVLTFNGFAGVRKFGGVLASSIEVREYASA